MSCVRSHNLFCPIIILDVPFTILLSYVKFIHPKICEVYTRNVKFIQPGYCEVEHIVQPPPSHTYLIVHSSLMRGSLICANYVLCISKTVPEGTDYLIKAQLAHFS